MWCKNREQWHRRALSFMIWCDRHQHELQASNDWINDKWYAWLHINPDHARAVDANYLNYHDFAYLCNLCSKPGGRYLPKYYKIEGL